jgi:hypothetical protein
MENQSRLIYQVAVGEVPDFYEACIQSVARYAARIGAEHIVQREPLLRIAPLNSQRSANALRLGYLPIFEKENAFEYLYRFDQVLILDADVYVRASAPDIFLELGDADFAGVVERTMPLTPAYEDKVWKHSQGQFSPLDTVGWDWTEKGAHYYNMGVMLLGSGFRQYLHGETPEQFLRRPEFQRFIDGVGHWRWSTDQTLLNWWLKDCGMQTRDLDWRWNALFGAVRDHRPAHFVHFFLSAKQQPETIRKAIAAL